jgi:hypothetical protein
MEQVPILEVGAVLRIHQMVLDASSGRQCVAAHQRQGGEEQELEEEDEDDSRVM